MTESADTVVRRQIVVDAPIERAFTVFTAHFGDFKPAEHNLLGAPIAETVFEPRVGGHIYDRAVDGTECRWARVLVYEPPDRVVFSWDISPQWQIETEPANTSEVEVRFVAETSQRTLVELEHRNLDRHGPGWESVGDGVGGDAGWPLYLTRYAALLSEGQLMAPITATTEVSQPATDVFAYATDPTRFSEWQQGVVEGRMDQQGEPGIGARCLTIRRIGFGERPVTAEVTQIDPPRTWSVRGIDGPIRASVDVNVEAIGGDRTRLTISVDFDGHGIGKLLVPLIIRRQARKEMPTNLAELKARLEQARSG